MAPYKSNKISALKKAISDVQKNSSLVATIGCPYLARPLIQVFTISNQLNSTNYGNISQATLPKPPMSMALTSTFKKVSNTRIVREKKNHYFRIMV